MVNTAGRPRKATPAKPVITPENSPEVPAGPAPGSTPVGETESDKRIRELEEKLALLMAEKENEASDSGKHEDKEGDIVLIHFVEDALTTLGRLWYRGQEIEFVVGSDAWKDTLDRNGDSWVSQSEEEQEDRRGKVYFRRGPWKGKGYKDAKWEKDAPPESELERADKLERDRRRAAPRLPSELSED